MPFRRKKGASIQLIPKFNKRLSAKDAYEQQKAEEKSENFAVPDSESLQAQTVAAITDKVEQAVSSDVENIAQTRGLGRFRQDPVRFMIRLTAEGSAFARGSGWRQYNEFVGAPILYPEYWEDMYKAVVRSNRVTAMVRSIVLAQHKQSTDSEADSEVEKETWNKIRNYLSALMADLSSRNTVRFTAFIVNNLLVRLYHQGIYIKGAEFLKLRQVALEAQEKGVSLIFLPCHKSHVDYLVISYLFFRLGIALPHIAAGQNLNLPVVGSFLRKGGAFFIRRTFGDDPIYATVFKEYIETLLRKGHNIEAFIEGTRSRTGKLLTPKLGVLKVILEAIVSGRVKDAYIVPMSIGYDKVIETESYVKELLGTEKQPESLEQLMNSTSVFQWKWGRIDVRFHEPWSLKQWVVREQQQRSPIDVTHPDKFSLLLRALGYRVLGHINTVSVVMPTALVSTIILTVRGRGASRDQLIRRVDWLRHEIIHNKGSKVAEFGDATDVIVDRVLTILGLDLIGERKELMVPVYYVKKRFELSFYRNQVIHLFIQEAIVCCSFYANLKYSTSAVPRPKLLEDVTFLSQLMKREFIYPRGSIDVNMDRTVRELSAKNVLVSDDESGDIDLSHTTRMTDREKFEFYCFLLWPFIESYWLSALSLLMLIRASSMPSLLFKEPEHPVDMQRWFSEKLFVEQVQQLGHTLYYQGELNYFESINKETLKNALFFLEEQHFVKRQSGYIAVCVDKYASGLTNAIHNCGKSNNSTDPANRYMSLIELVQRIQDYRRDRDSVGLLHRVVQGPLVLLNQRVQVLVEQGRHTLAALEVHLPPSLTTVTSSLAQAEDSAAMLLAKNKL